MRLTKVILSLLFATILIFSYQNCSGSFKPINSKSLQSFVEDEHSNNIIDQNADLSDPVILDADLSDPVIPDKDLLTKGNLWPSEYFYDVKGLALFGPNNELYIENEMLHMDAQSQALAVKAKIPPLEVGGTYRLQ